jgi:hypothetical protein
MKCTVAIGVMAWLLIATAFIATTRAQEKSEDKTIDDGEWLSMVGELTKSGDRAAFKVTEGDHKGKTFIILENAKLEEMEKKVKEEKLTSIKISCEVTKYNKKNYLIMGSFSKPGEEEPGEGPGEEPEEGDDE